MRLISRFLIVRPKEWPFHPTGHQIKRIFDVIWRLNSPFWKIFSIPAIKLVACAHVMTHTIYQYARILGRFTSFAFFCHVFFLYLILHWLNEFCVTLKKHVTPLCYIKAWVENSGNDQQKALQRIKLFDSPNDKKWFKFNACEFLIKIHKKW